MDTLDDALFRWYLGNPETDDFTELGDDENVVSVVYGHGTGQVIRLHSDLAAGTWCFVGSEARHKTDGASAVGAEQEDAAAGAYSSDGNGGVVPTQANASRLDEATQEEETPEA